MTPASFRAALPLNPGSYLVRVTVRDTTDVFALEVSDSTLQLEPRTARHTQADTSVQLRYPRNSFAFFCNTGEPPCEDMRTWIAGREGVSEIQLPPGVTLPSRYRDRPGEALHYFQYSDARTLDEVRLCFEAVRPLIREAVGVYMSIETWRGDALRTGSTRSFDQPHIERPARISHVC